MPKQTRLNCSKQSTTSSKRRKLDSDDETDEQNERPPQRLKTTGSSNTPLSNAEEKKSPPPPPPPQKSHPTTKNPTPNTNSSPSTTTTTHITLTHQTASLFASPPSTLLCHATNAQGSWGAGIALAFKKSYPSAFALYASHCSKWNPSSLLGTTLLIPPQRTSALKAEREARHWIACLFTSEKKGKGKGSRESILAATGEAVGDLVRKVRGVNGSAAADADDGVKAGSGSGGGGGGGGGGDRIAEVRMCKINSGLFGVPWDATRRVIEAVEVGEGDVKEIAVYSLD